MIFQLDVQGLVKYTYELSGEPIDQGNIVQGKYWVAKIVNNKQQIHIGTFNTDIEAAKAYDKKAIELHGEFAKLNFPLENYKL